MSIVENSADSENNWQKAAQRTCIQGFGNTPLTQCECGWVIEERRLSQAKKHQMIHMDMISQQKKTK